MVETRERVKEQRHRAPMPSACGPIFGIPHGAKKRLAPLHTTTVVAIALYLLMWNTFYLQLTICQALFGSRWLAATMVIVALPELVALVLVLLEHNRLVQRYCSMIFGCGLFLLTGSLLIRLSLFQMDPKWDTGLHVVHTAILG